MPIQSSKCLRGDHAAEHPQDVLVDCLVDSLADVPLGVQFTCVLDLQLLLVLFGFFIDTLSPFNGQFRNFLEIFMTVFCYFSLVSQL